MNTIVKTIAGYTIFSICGEQTNEQGKVFIRIIDFAGECLYNDFIDADKVESKLISKEIFDESNRLCGFTLPNGVNVIIDYNEDGKPTLLRTAFGNIKDIKYYESGCVQSVRSYSDNIRHEFYNLTFKDGEVALEKNADGGNINE